MLVPVPDFFQDDSEDALRSRIQWLEAEVGLSEVFFANLLRTDKATFARWQENRGTLPPGELLGLREVWEMMMHVLSFVNFDSERAQKLLEYVPSPAAADPARGAGEVLPWAGLSIKTYLEANGPEGVDSVNRWITSFRFGAPSLSAEHEVACPSIPD